VQLYYMSLTEISEKFIIKKNTISKAIGAGRLHKAIKKELNISQALSETSTTNIMARIATSLGGLQSISPNFQHVVFNYPV